MNADETHDSPELIQGQLLRLSDRREVAIYLRRGTLWVADFIDGDGQLVDAVTWFQFNCGAPSAPHARRRMVRESATPLQPELVARIEHLHGCLPCNAAAKEQAHEPPAACPPQNDPADPDDPTHPRRPR
jgi:hypothetical protein